MTRAIVQPADVTGAATDELKQWLGITRIDEDDQLAGLLRTSLDLCEAFTGQIPVEAGIVEVHQAQSGWQPLHSRPVRAITAIDMVEADGTRVPLDGASYEIEIDAAGTGTFRLTGPAGSTRVAVSLVAGIAPDWNAAPDAIKHGIIRLAAHHYLGRDHADHSGSPASVAALWRPWKQMRIA